jgi:hypothetical protein
MVELTPAEAYVLMSFLLFIFIGMPICCLLCCTKKDKKTYITV